VHVPTLTISNFASVAHSTHWRKSNCPWEERSARLDSAFPQATVTNIVHKRFVCGSPVKFQITILKVLADLGQGILKDERRCLSRSAVAMLMSSGTDWTDRDQALGRTRPWPRYLLSKHLFLSRDTRWQNHQCRRALLASGEKPCPGAWRPVIKIGKSWLCNDSRRSRIAADKLVAVECAGPRRRGRVTVYAIRRGI